MALEIERRFLVVGDAWRTAAGVLIRQGYLSRAAPRIVRIRVSGGFSWITVKGLATGATRSEFEYPIPRADGEALLTLCEPPLIEKTRYRVRQGGRWWEIDEFHADNTGLVTAEVELGCENDQVEFPPWVGAEVTHDPRYFNSNLAACPYSRWKRQPRA